ncbi:MAG: alpha/beta hydrolase-fold protein [Planctomycetota bacterium]|nr:alpha/beta hydrolase-fold protein [Planctomycetota bacterium]
MTPPRIELGAPIEEAKAVLICLHGRGVDARDLAPIGDELALPGWHVRLPNAPLPFPGGGLAWYAGEPGREDGIDSAARGIGEEVSRIESAGISSRSIAILGFSQGAVVGLHSALRHPSRLGAALALSGYLYAPEKTSEEASEASRDLPIFIGHGTSDPLLPVGGAQTAAKLLEEQGYPIEYHEYPIGHSISVEELADIAGFLRRVIG